MKDDCLAAALEEAKPAFDTLLAESNTVSRQLSGQVNEWHEQAQQYLRDEFPYADNEKRLLQWQQAVEKNCQTISQLRQSIEDYLTFCRTVR